MPVDSHIQGVQYESYCMTNMKYTCTEIPTHEHAHACALMGLAHLLTPRDCAQTCAPEQDGTPHQSKHTCCQACQAGLTTQAFLMGRKVKVGDPVQVLCHQRQAEVAPCTIASTQRHAHCVSCIDNMAPLGPQRTQDGRFWHASPWCIPPTVQASNV